MARKVKHKGRGGWLFLAIVLLAYGVTAVLNPDVTMQALEAFLHVFKQVVPALGLIFVLLYLADRLLTPTWITQHLGPTAGTRGWLAAVFGGVLSVGPVYVWYTLLRELQHKGMRLSLIHISEPTRPY